jgi:rRNA maturation RNase YbeY
MKISISNRQTAHGLRKTRIRQLARYLMGRSECRDRKTWWGEVSLVFTDDAGIACTNRDFLHSPDATDVIAFRYDPLPGQGDCYDAEIIVNVQMAVQEGPSRGGISRELALYVAHGCDHLSGEDDNTPAGYARMRRRELRWLKNAADKGLLNDLVIENKGKNERC